MAKLQAFPQLPQLAGSVWKSLLAVPPHSHTLEPQSPPWQLVPHVPQFRASPMVSTSQPLRVGFWSQLAKSLRQPLKTQRPLLQVTSELGNTSAQTLPQAPQFSTSVERLVGWPLQVHSPPSQVPPQVLAQAPQSVLLVSVSTQLPPQQVSPLAQAFAHVPQFSASEARSAQVLPQSVPLAQTQVPESQL